MVTDQLQGQVYFGIDTNYIRLATEEAVTDHIYNHNLTEHL